jgi:hypothetical protein
MRAAVLPFAIAGCLAFAPVGPGHATSAPGIETRAGAYEHVHDRRCGPHHHWVRGHHLTNGQWVRGRCVRDRHYYQRWSGYDERYYHPHYDHVPWKYRQ